MTDDEYETAKARRDNLQGKLDARKRLGEGYTTNTAAIAEEVDRLAGEIAAHEATLDEGEGGS